MIAPDEGVRKGLLRGKCASRRTATLMAWGVEIPPAAAFDRASTA
jgi:hypothetical protein